MADYIYLLEHRLSQSQKNALTAVREIARERALTVFLVGGAVRDLTSGSPVRDLDVVVQGNALKLKKEIEKAGGSIVGEYDPLQSLFVRFPGGAEVEIGSALSVTYPKPGKPVAHAASILDDLRRRDFTANAMAISLNTGSYGLLMDPLNGVADIENRELRLVSNYGFIEDPIRMVRAVRLGARLGWQMDEKTQARYATGKEEGYISAASAFQRGYETEEIVREEDPLRVMRRLEAEDWMSVLTPHWNSSRANVAELERLRESQTQLQMQGIHPNTAAANFPLLTAKLSAAEVAELKASFARPGFVREIDALEAEAREFAAQFSAKSAALPSQSWKLLYSAKPEAVLLVAHSSKSAAIQAKFKSFYTEWPLARQKVPHSLLQEMRITPELPGYAEFIESLVFELMDGKLGTVEEMKAFIEPFSPPAPPPTVHVRRARSAKKDVKAGKGRAKKPSPDGAAPGDPNGEAGGETPDGGNPDETPAEASVAASPVAAEPPAVEKSALEKSALERTVKVAAKSAAGESASVKVAAAGAGKTATESARKVPTLRKEAAPEKSVPGKSAPAIVRAASPTEARAAKVPAPAKTVVAKDTQVKAVAAKRQSGKTSAEASAKTGGKTNRKNGAKAPAKVAAKKPAAKAPGKAAARKAAVKLPAAKLPAKAAKTGSKMGSKVAAKAAVKKTVAKAPAKKRR